MDKSKIGKSNDFWERYEEDIQLATKVGANSFRFSFEWHRIEPRRGEIDESAIKRYHEILDCLERYKLIPNATIHHFVHPDWFQDLGAFESPESVPLYVEYAKVCFKHFGDRVTYWSTFNEPTCAIFCGFIIGGHPPGKLLAFRAAGKALMNMLMSHTRAYHAIKKMPHGERSQIGLVNHHVWFEPSLDSWLYAHVKWACYWANLFWGKDVVREYFQTDRFHWEVPLVGIVWDHTEPGAKESLDWVGINYYSRGVFNWFCFPRVLPGEVKTDMGYNIYGPGMYEAIKHWSVLGLPMYITETGCADSKDEYRDKFINSYFDNCVRAIRDGYDVRGFYYWTLIDNFEWNCGYSMKFGLFKWDDDGQHLRVLREKSKVLIHIFKAWPSSLKEFVAASKKWSESYLALGAEDAGLEAVRSRQEEMGVHTSASIEPQKSLEPQVA